MKRDFLSIKDLTRDEILYLLDKGLETKKAGRDTNRPLTGCTLGLLFDKASTRTRVAFETAMFRLGGQTIFLSKGDTQLARDEAISDTARVLSRYVDALAIRTFSQQLVEEMAKWADIPVINALTDMYHPCQVLSDLMTVKERKGAVDKMKVTWIGDGNNMAHSWIHAARVLGFELVLACPSGHHPKSEILGAAGENIRVVGDPAEAALGADVINTDVWASMGQDAERKQRLLDFQGFQVNESLVALGSPSVLVLHCLPAHRGEEISADVLEKYADVIFDQAENKMHLHQALLEWLLNT
jgi:ornithine carbamoyltransferase